MMGRGLLYILLLASCSTPYQAKRTNADANIWDFEKEYFKCDSNREEVRAELLETKKGLGQCTTSSDQEDAANVILGTCMANTDVVAFHGVFDISWRIGDDTAANDAFGSTMKERSLYSITCPDNTCVGYTEDLDTGREGRMKGITLSVLPKENSVRIAWGVHVFTMEIVIDQKTGAFHPVAVRFSSVARHVGAAVMICK